jgi:chromosome partitioning protein
MGRVIAIANQKGGAGKTATAIHLAAAIAEMGHKVLLIDMDPQGHVAEHFGLVSEQLSTEMSDVIEGSHTITEIIIPEIRPNLDIAPSNIRLSDMELTLVNLRFREFKLQRALEPVMKDYAYMLIDCPPNLGLLTVNALMVAKHVIIPMATEYASMLGVSLLINTIQSIKKEANPDLEVMGIVHTRNKHTTHAREVVERTKVELGDHVRIFEPPVNDSTRFSEAFGMGQTVFEIAPEIPGAHAYRKIAQEVVNHG